MLKMFQDMKTSIKREIEDDESNDLDLKEEIPLKKPKNDEIQIKEEQVEYDDDSEGRLADKTCDNNGEESIQSNVSKKERGANKGTPKSSESSLQVENPLEELFWVQDGLYFEEQDPNSLSASNLPASTNDPTTSKGVSTSQQVTVNEMVYNFRKRTLRERLLEEEDEDETVAEEVSDNEDYVSEISDDSDDDETGNEEEIKIEDSERKIKNFALSKKLRHSNARVRQLVDPPVNIPGPIGDAANLESIEQFWSVLFNDEMINIIVECTNAHIEDHCAHLMAKNQEIQSYHHQTDAEEMKAFIALLYYSGLWKSHRVDTRKLWSYENGTSFYKCVMAHKRFGFLSLSLRFDIKTTRNPEDRFAPIRNLWEIFNGNCVRNYNSSNKCTVDEQLLGFRGYCKFRVYMKSKHDKYGLMFKTLNDAETAYLIHAVPYLGKNHGVSSDESVPEFYFREVTTPIHGTYRTVTCDNWFTSISLLENMMDDPYNLTITGAIKKNKREIPSEMKLASEKFPDSKFCFSDKITLLSFTPKKNKVALLASTFSSSTEIIDGKPNLISHYNKTKDATDAFDKLCYSFTTARKTSRWPVRIFFGILDQAIVNARILLSCKLINDKRTKKVSAQQCMQGVIDYLTKPFLMKRYKTVTLRKDIRYSIAGILKMDINEAIPNESQIIIMDSYKRCTICPSKKDRKTKSCCAACRRPICKVHRSGLCIYCGSCK